MVGSRGAMRRATRALAQTVAAVLLSAATVCASPTPKLARPKKTAGAQSSAAVTDANVVDRVLSVRTKTDHQALAAYYKAKAGAEEARIAQYEQLFRAYVRLEGKPFEPLQRQARLLLKAARMSQHHYALLAQAHLTVAAEYDVHQ